MMLVPCPIKIHIAWLGQCAVKVSVCVSIGKTFSLAPEVCKTHLGTRNVDFRMKRYVFRRTVDGIHIIHLGKTWEKPLCRFGSGLCLAPLLHPGPALFQHPATDSCCKSLLT